jgi:hypothetical protein
MSASIRPATPHDLPAIVELLIRDAQQRASLDPRLWRLAPDAGLRVERAAAATLDGSEGTARALWHVAEHAGRIVGVTHAMLVPVPPIYDGAAGPPGVLRDDCCIFDAPSSTPEALLAATESALRAAGAARLVASCPASGPLRLLYARHGYEPVTLYMAKHGLRPAALAPAVRPAVATDVPGIVELSAAHRETLNRLNARFWHIHREADGRFDAWMRRSLTLRDRDMLVAGVPGAVHGYVIAQPCPPLLVPDAHDAAAIGVVDDFYDKSFANLAAAASGSAGADLLAAAEGAFARRGVDSALVVCPAAWSSKVALLERAGFRTAKLWMLKR